MMTQVEETFAQKLYRKYVKAEFTGAEMILLGSPTYIPRAHAYQKDGTGLHLGTWLIAAIDLVVGVLITGISIITLSVEAASLSVGMIGLFALLFCFGLLYLITTIAGIRWMVRNNKQRIKKITN